MRKILFFAVGLFLFVWFISSLAVAAEFKGVIDYNNDGVPDQFIFSYNGLTLKCVSRKINDEFYLADCYDLVGNYYKFQAVTQEEGWLKEIEE